MGRFPSTTSKALAAVVVIALVALGGRPALAVRVQVTRVDGAVFTGELRGADDGITVHDESGTQRLTWDELLGMEVLASPESAAGFGRDGAAPSPRSGLRIALADGSEFNASVEKLLEGDLLLLLPDGQSARVAIDSIRWVRREQAPVAALAKQSESWAEMDRSGAASAATEDVAVVARGDQPLVLRGAVRRVDASGIRFHWNGRELPLEWGRLAGVRFARPQGRTASTVVNTRDGMIFAGRPLRSDDAGLVLRSSAFDSLKLPWDRVARLDVRSGKIFYLSDAIPQNFEFDPLFGPAWGYAMNRTFSGGTVHLSGRAFSKAITMHSQSRMFFAVPEEASRFAATVGVLDAYPHGRVAVRVLGDDRVLWSAEDVKGGEEPREVSVDIRGVHVLQLAVDWGADMDLGDHVAWGQARLVRD